MNYATISNKFSHVYLYVVAKKKKTIASRRLKNVHLPVKMHALYIISLQRMRSVADKSQSQRVCDLPYRSMKKKLQSLTYI